MDVALASCRRLPEPDPDMPPLRAALAGAGLEAQVLAWDDPAADWSAARLTVLRSTWDYPHRPAAFLRWVDAVAAVSALWNPPAAVRWNAHKRYLLDLEARGVPVAPTALLRRGSRRMLRSLLAERGWETAVIKPAVSASSFRTMRVGAGDVDAGEEHLRALLAERDVLVQRYLPSVEGHGERALVWIDGALTHAVRKRPRFAGQHESVSAEAVPIAPAEEELARRALAAVDAPVLYARVDMAPGPAGEPVVMELELIEPSLFFPQSAAALERYVAAILRLLGRGR
jgi:glutathione synthase/RimK-type ligase-like ATP-grasp enzyme